MTAAVRFVPGLGPFRLLAASVAGGASDEGVLGSLGAGVESAGASSVAVAGSRTMWGAVAGGEEDGWDACEGVADGNLERCSGDRRSTTVLLFVDFAVVDMVAASVLLQSWLDGSPGPEEPRDR